MPTMRLLIKGKVQGVFFRATAIEVAEELGVQGWVRNTLDGEVEVMVSGTVDQLQKYIDWCKRGPRRAVVTDVVVSNEPETDFAGFQVIR